MSLKPGPTLKGGKSKPGGFSRLVSRRPHNKTVGDPFTRDVSRDLVTFSVSDCLVIRQSFQIMRCCPDRFILTKDDAIVAEGRSVQTGVDYSFKMNLTHPYQNAVYDGIGALVLCEDMFSYCYLSQKLDLAIHSVVATYLIDGITSKKKDVIGIRLRGGDLMCIVVGDIDQIKQISKYVKQIHGTQWTDDMAILREKNIPFTKNIPESLWVVPPRPQRKRLDKFELLASWLNDTDGTILDVNSSSHFLKSPKTFFGLFQDGIQDVYYAKRFVISSNTDANELKLEFEASAKGKGDPTSRSLTIKLDLNGVHKEHAHSELKSLLDGKKCGTTRFLDEWLATYGTKWNEDKVFALQIGVAQQLALFDRIFFLAADKEEFEALVQYFTLVFTCTMCPWYRPTL